MQAASPNKSTLTEAQEGGQGAQNIQVTGQGNDLSFLHPRPPLVCIRGRCPEGGPPGCPPLPPGPTGCGLQEEAWGGEVGGRACLHLMDGPEEMSGTCFPLGGGEAVATSPPLICIPACLPACLAGRGWGERLEQGQEGPAESHFANYHSHVCPHWHGNAGTCGQPRSLNGIQKGSICSHPRPFFPAPRPPGAKEARALHSVLTPFPASDFHGPATT